MIYNIRTAKREEMKYFIDWAAAEGWNPGLHDGDCFYNTDPDGFIVGEYEGSIVGAISAVAYDDTFGFIGFYIVQPEHRNTSLAPLLARHGSLHLNTQNIGVDGVFDKVAKYESIGFKLAYRNLRYESQIKGEISKNVVPVADIPFDKVLDFDTKFFPTQRESFLKNWLSLPDSRSYAILSNDEIQGYGMIRKCQKGFKIGPLFAGNVDIAEELLLSLAVEAKGDLVYLDVPEVNKDGVELAKKYDMTECFGTARMYSKELPKLPTDKIFGVTSFELG
jgi:hypothetical protein